jgi:hypothetical protein
MFSDALPYTMWDSMELDPGAARTSGQPSAPSGFQQRDAVAAKEREDLMKLKASMGQEGPMPMPPAPQVGSTAVPPPPPRTMDVDITDTEVDLGSRKLPSKTADIGDYRNVGDLTYILIAVLIVDVIVIFAVRYLPEIFGAPINRWYDLFGLNAVIADVMIIVIGFMVARHLWILFVQPKYSPGKWSALKFTGLTVAVQLVHDLLFYFGVILQVPRGHNMMMDVFRQYAESGGWKILGADAAMMVGSAGIAMLLKSLPMYHVAAVAALTVYSLPYILYTKNQFSVLK